MRVAARVRQVLGRRRAPDLIRPDRPSRLGTPARDLHGTAPDGKPVEVAVDRQSVVLLFLTSSCFGCRVLWEGMAASVHQVPSPEMAPRVVVVTPSPSTESARQVAALASEGIEVVMSSDAWHAYGVTGAPWCVVVADGVVAADGPAPPTWTELLRAHSEASRS
jgi:hypothetical protein